MTIHFIVNGKTDCMVRARVTNSVRVMMRLDMTVSDFFKNN